MSLITHSTSGQIKTINTLDHIHAELEYPKIIVVENKRAVHLVTIASSGNKLDSALPQYSLEFDEEIICNVRQNSVVWILLKSREIVRLDILQQTKTHILIDNFIIREIYCDGNDSLLFASEGGEWLIFPPNVMNMNFGINERDSALTISLIKTQMRSSEIQPTKNVWRGLALSCNKNNILLKCPITGIIEVIDVNEPIEHILEWDDNMSVVVQEKCMRVITLSNALVCYNFVNEEGSKYCPLKVYKGILYYVSYRGMDIQVCCAWNSSATTLENAAFEDPLQNVSPISSQDTLKSELMTLIESEISDNKVVQNISQLRPYFEKIDDNCFLIDNASKLCQHSLEYKSILYLLQNRIYASEDYICICLLTDLIIKIDLLEYLTFKGNKSYDAINLFGKNFIELCVLFISKSDLDLASMCWLKYSEMKLNVTSDDLNAVLNSVPFNLKMSTLIIWLKNFVPSLLDENPFFIDHFVKWTMERVFMLEQSSYWPKIGLKFIEEIIAVLEMSLKLVMIRPVSMDDLDVVKDRIYYIIELKEKYRINMTLNEFSTQSPSELALIMLRRCYTEDLDLFLKVYLPSYATRHMYEHDDTLRSYIESEAASSGGGVDGFRLKHLLQSFHSTSNKLDCLLQVLKVLDVPWDSNVLDLAVNAAASYNRDFTVTDTDRTLAQEIHKELNYAKLKVVLKKYNFPLTCSDYVLVLNKLMNSTNVDLEDLKIVTNVMTNFKTYGNILYINKCLTDCETKMALNYFSELNCKEKNILVKTAMIKYEQIINSKIHNVVIQKNYLDFLKGTGLLSDYQIADIENLYHLKSSYGIVMTLNNIYDEQLCQEKTYKWIYEDGGLASSTPGACVSKLTRTHQSCDAVLVNILRQTSASDSVRKFLENLLQIRCFKSMQNNTKSSQLSSFKDGLDSTLLMNSYSVLIDVLLKCDEEYLHKLTRYLAILNSLINSSILLRNLSVVWKFQYIYLPMSSISGINNLINSFDSMISEKYLNCDEYNVPEGYDFLSIKMVSNMSYNALAAIDEVSLGNDYYAVRNKLIKKILSKIILSQEIDEILLTSLLIIINEEEESNDRTWILDVLRGQNETFSPGMLCYLSNPIIRHIFNLDDNSCTSPVTYPPQYLLKTRFNINFADVASMDHNEQSWDVKVILFCVLRQNPDLHFNRIVEICRTLNISLNDGLSLQLVSLISTWELCYKIYNDDLNCRQIHFKNDENALLNKCLILWENIEQKELIKDILNDLWQNGEVSLHGRSVSINPYYYEVYLCIFYLLFGSSTEVRFVKEFFLLNFLKEYRRKSVPKQYEFELFSIKGMFPEVGYYRLPFHLFMRDDMWSNLKSEITLETYERWLPVVGLLSLDADMQTARDMICSNALKQTMTSRKRLESNDIESSENEPWHLTTREEPLLRAAHKCVRHIANMEWAGACLFYVLQGCARGADQVAAAQLCYQFAQRWAAIQPGNRAVRQMERLHISLSTRHALHRMEWACEEFVRLSTEPTQLIRALYLHPLFVQKMTRHDINRAANEIADKNGINISSIRIQILENILEKANEDNKNIKISSLNSRELRTARYILKATCPKMGAIYLSRIAFDDDSDFNKRKKLRALQCLMSVIETDTAVKVTNRERDALWGSLLELVHVVNLENIDMPWIVATFMQNKIKAIEQLLQANTNVEGLKIAAELSRRYGNTKTIQNLVPLLLRAGLYEEMTPLLLKMSSPPNELVYQAWRAVIVSPFQRADYPITERQKINCINAVNLLPVCSVIKDEDLVEIWKNCIRCKCFGIGCLVLPYMTSQTRQSLSELQRIDKRNLIASLKNLQSETYLISGAMHVIEKMPLRSQR